MIRMEKVAIGIFTFVIVAFIAICIALVKSYNGTAPWSP